MRWYVSRGGDTVGPVDEAQVVEWFHAGMRDGMVRDEAGGPWTPIMQSPFAFSPPPRAAAAAPVVKAGEGVKPPRWLVPSLAGGAALTLAALGYLGSLGPSADEIKRRAEIADAKEKADARARTLARQAEQARLDQLPTPSPTADKVAAWSMAQQFVTDSLKSPGSADFGGLFSGEFQRAEDHVTDLGDGSFRAHGWVDATNSFGAKVRSDFTITLKYMGNDRWQAVDGPNIVGR